MKARIIRHILLIGLALTTAFLLWCWLTRLAASMPGAKFAMPQSIVMQVLYILIFGVTLAFLFRACATVATRFLAAPAVLTAIGAYVGSYACLVLVSALLYAQINTFEQGKAFNNHPTLLDLLYFSAVTASTVGFGDYQPLTGYVKAVSILEATASIILIGVYLGSVSGLLRQNAEDDKAKIPPKPPRNA